jgi:tellurite resistance protein
VQDREKLELFKAALAVAAADGQLARAEMGVVEGLAARVGIGQASLEAMKAAALRGEYSARGLQLVSPDEARRALQLLVAEARIDGEISDAERSVLVLVADRLGIGGEAFQAAYQAGIDQADEIRRRRSGSA